jgi:diketogulonate reductase-like aldo/keto reductase
MRARAAVGMGPDPGGIKSQMDEMGVVLQAYSPLGAGTTDHPRHPELISGELVRSIGAKHGKSGAQVSLRWIVQNGVAVAAESTNERHLASDLDIFDFELDAEDMAMLDAANSPSGHYSFRCDA